MKSRNKKILRILISIACLIPILFVTANKLPAGFTSPTLKTRIEIDGVNFGVFEQIQGLDQFSSAGLPVKNHHSYAKVTLSRNFVTDPSLYLWVKNRMSRKSELKNIYLITEDENKKMISKQILESCQPLSWSVESINPSLGGFNETIDLAVQKISAF